MLKPCVRGWCFTLTGIVVLVVGLFSASSMLETIEDELNKFLQVKTEGEDPTRYERYINQKVDPDPAISLRKIYMFNLTNLQEVVLLGETPNYEEIGPYSFNSYTIRYNDSFNADQTLMTARERVEYYFLPEKSCAACSLTDKITGPNIVVAGTLEALPKDQSDPALLLPLVNLGNWLQIFFTILEDFAASTCQRNVDCIKLTVSAQWGSLEGILPTAPQPVVATGQTLAESPVVMSQLQLLSPPSFKFINELKTTFGIDGEIGKLPEGALVTATIANQWIYGNKTETGAFCNILEVDVVPGLSCGAYVLQVFQTASAQGLDSTQAAGAVLLQFPLFETPETTLAIINYLNLYAIGANNAIAKLSHSTMYTLPYGHFFVTKTVNEWLFREDNIVAELLGGADGNPNRFVLIGNYTQEESYRWEPHIFSSWTTGKRDITRRGATVCYEQWCNILPKNAPGVPGFCGGPTPIDGRSGYQLFGPGRKTVYWWRSRVSRSTTSYVWDNDARRSAGFGFEKAERVNGIELLRYQVQLETIKANATFDMQFNTLLDQTCLTGGIPVVASFPHFYGADDLPNSWKPNGILPPDRERDSLFYWVLEAGGFTMKGQVSIQVNIKGRRNWYSVNPNTTLRTNYTLFPIFFRTNFDTLSDEDFMGAEDFQGFINLSEIVFLVAVLLGPALIVSGVLGLSKAMMVKKDQLHGKQDDEAAANGCLRVVNYCEETIIKDIPLTIIFGFSSSLLLLFTFSNNPSNEIFIPAAPALASAIMVAFVWVVHQSIARTPWICFVYFPIWLAVGFLVVFALIYYQATSNNGELAVNIIILVAVVMVAFGVPGLLEKRSTDTTLCPPKEQEYFYIFFVPVMLGWIAYLTTMTAAGSEAVPSVIIACIYIALLLWSSSLLLHFFPRAARRRNRYSTMLGLIFAFAAAPHGAANIAFSVFDYSKSPLAAYAATRAFVLLCMTVAKQMVLAMDMIIQVPTAAVDDSSVLTPPFVAVQVAEFYIIGLLLVHTNGFDWEFGVMITTNVLFNLLRDNNNNNNIWYECCCLQAWRRKRKKKRTNNAAKKKEEEEKEEEEELRRGKMLFFGFELESQISFYEPVVYIIVLGHILLERGLADLIGYSDNTSDDGEQESWLFTRGMSKEDVDKQLLVLLSVALVSLLVAIFSWFHLVRRMNRAEATSAKGFKKKRGVVERGISPQDDVVSSVTGFGREGFSRNQNRQNSDMALRKKDSNMSINSDLNEEHKFGGGESSSKQQYETKTSRISSSIPAAAETSMIISDTISRRGGDSMVEVEMKEAKSKDDNTASVMEKVGKMWRKNRSTSLMGVLHGLTVVYVWQYLVYYETTNK